MYEQYEHLREARTFRRLMDQPVGRFCKRLAPMQATLIAEEYEEFLEAHCEAVIHERDYKSRENCLKELADLVYVSYQYAAAAGWDLDEALTRVHESNLSKLDDNLKPIKRDDGKVMKGPNYKPANLSDLV